MSTASDDKRDETPPPDREDGSPTDEKAAGAAEGEGEGETETEEGEPDEAGAAGEGPPEEEGQDAAPAEGEAGEPEPAAARPKGRKKKGEKKASPLRNVLLFVVIVGGLAAAFAFLGQETGGSQASPKWKNGDVIDVSITLVTTDVDDLACANDGEIAGRYCGYEAPRKKYAKAQNARQDANLLQPYTTTEPRLQFLAAGLWTQPALKDKLAKEDWDHPSPRFSVKCKLKVEGKAKSPQVQWKPGEGWHPQPGWYTGSISECKLGG
ncbi:MAG: hypothetical protein HY744_03775 [Deltaproteobacteria bacterium]|nr:hypothetical protein [Deltaproteobacteria bacterium]